MQEFTGKEKAIRESILEELRNRYPKDKWVRDDFKKVVEHSYIVRMLRLAQQETAVKKWINKHGVEHGLKVARNLLTLFKLIEEELVESDSVKDYAGVYKEVKLKNSHVLFALLVAGYVHDVGRFYDRSIKHEWMIEDAIKELEGAIQYRDGILQGILPSIQHAILRIIREVCLCHGKKYEKSDKVEVAMVKLADVLDCDKERVYTREEKKDLPQEESEKTKVILLTDERPEDYFSCSATDEVIIEWSDESLCINVTIKTDNAMAATVAIKKILSVLKKTIEQENTRPLAERVLVFLQGRDPKGRKIKLWPKGLPPTPRGILDIKQEYVFRIKNMEGDTEIEEVLEIANVNFRGKLKSLQFTLGGDYPAPWNDRENTFIDIYQVINKEERAISKQYILREPDGAHTWRAIFPHEIGVGDSIVIKGVYIWKKFFKVRESFFSYAPFKPLNSYKCSIHFPAGITPQKIKATFSVRFQGRLLCDQNLTPILQPAQNSALLSIQAKNLVPDIEHILRWEITE